ncbi:SIMPL domain-containing protein [Actinoplanes sp. NPDC026619]|uniref:SIMPL domain-containing protein n=1 Tax=Actinoplanes sp. NPDC026619 TaxID=3155798 RepID=UPI0033E81F9A
MNRSRHTAPALVALATLLVFPLLGARPAAASTMDPGADDKVLVTGKGEMSAEPDTLTADLAVETVAATVGEALDRAGTAATRMRNALVRAGIARADLQTSNVSVNSRTDDDQQITGYTVNQGLTAKIRDLPRAGALMSTAVAAGGDAARLNGVSFAIENEAPLLAEARKKAFADARAKAELYAREAGRPLGRVISVSEVAPGFAVPGPQYSMAGAADARFSIEPGRQRLSVTVTVEWALGRI